MLNFLPPEERNNLNQEIRFFSLRKQSLTICLTILFCVTIFTANTYLLRKRVNELDASYLSLQQSRVGTQTIIIENQIRDFNTQVKSFSTLIKQRYSLVDRLATIANALPPSITVEQISINPVDSFFILQGVARDRQSYLDLKDSLISTGYFVSVDLPITDFLARESIRFTLRSDLTDVFSDPFTL